VIEKINGNNFRDWVKFFNIVQTKKETMKANELRIGNLVCPFDNVQKAIFNDCIKICSKDFEDTSHLHPIPLTEEWLVSFGLNYLQNACWELGSMRIYNLSDEYKSRFRITLAGNELCILNYVHQLQNLYFALTGEELVLR
jgi:hypothetical protein